MDNKFFGNTFSLDQVKATKSKISSELLGKYGVVSVWSRSKDKVSSIFIGIDKSADMTAISNAILELRKAGLIHSIDVEIQFAGRIDALNAAAIKI